jgi:protein phosphatase
MKTYLGSERGMVRNENEDSLILHIPEDPAALKAKGILAAVADGVGGGPAGKYASSLAVDVVREAYYNLRFLSPEKGISRSFQFANQTIRKEASTTREYFGMSTTCTAFVCIGHKGFYCHIGDCRAYLFRDGVLHQLTRDHSLVNELIEGGIISQEEGRFHPQRNIILKVLGSSGDISPDIGTIELVKNDTILLCSDGLHGYSSDEEISSILEESPVEKAGKGLIDLSLSKGGYDNVSVIIIRI